MQFVASFFFFFIMSIVVNKSYGHCFINLFSLSVYFFHSVILVAMLLFKTEC